MKDMLSTMLTAMPVGIGTCYDGELVFLNVLATGSVLGIQVVRDVSDAHVSSLLQHAVLGAHDFEAGLCVDESENALLLTQWIPGAKSWLEVADSLERLVFQARIWRGACDTVSDGMRAGHRMDYDEKQLRDKLMAGGFTKHGEPLRKPDN